MTKDSITLIVSDIHIGCSKSRVTEFIEFLKNIKYDTIIFNGDIIDFIVKGDNNKLCEHCKYVKEILKLIKGKKVYYLPGNHDKWLLLLIPFGWLFNMTIRKRLNYKGYIIEHGDWISYYLKIRRLFNKSIIIYTDGGITGEDDFHNNTIEYSKIKRKPIIVGHSHVPLIVDNIMYDDGDWFNNDNGTIHDTYIIMIKNLIEIKKHNL